jgi:DNA-binding CsgD family transcriptional regulator
VRNCSTNRQIETFYLHKFVASAAGRIIDGKAGGGGRIRISRGEERAPLIVLVIPLRAETEWLSPRRPTAILFITDPERANTPTAASLQHSFGLTRTEAAVALQVLNGKGLQAAAAVLGIAPVTARSHLAAIFAKTGTSRQAELVRVLLQSDGGVRSE